MAPGRRRGGKGTQGNSEFSIGDLVLAKVKGFPAWPAKISRPQDWDHAPDPKKYFVHFFGTNEIAFVAPADIQAFTSEVKNKLLARSQIKTVKYFSAAVEEICQEFEAIQHKDSGSSRDIIDQSDVDSEALSGDAEEEVIEDGFEDGTRTESLSEETDIKSLEHCSQRQDELDSHDTKSRNSCKAGESSSQVLSSKKKKKKNNNPPDDEGETLKEVVLALSCPKEGGDNQEDANDVEKTVRKDISSVKTAKSRDKDSGKRAQMTASSKSKPKESHDFHKNDTSSDTVVSKKATGSIIREPHKEPKLDMDSASERKKELGKRRKMIQDKGGNSEQHARREIPGSKIGAQLGLKKHELEKNKNSYAGKTAKRADEANVASKGRKHGLTSSDEDDLPPSKHRREASEAPLPSSATKTSENGTGKSTAVKENGEFHANTVKNAGSQLQTKRRAVQICDDDDEERPKTPVHGRPASKVSASASLKKTSRQGEGSHSVKIQNEHSSLGSDQSLDKRVKKVISTPVSHSPAKPLEKVSSQTEKQILGPSMKSPLGSAGNRQMSEPRKADVSGAGNLKKGQTGPSKGTGLVSDGSRYTKSLANSDQSKTVSSGRSKSMERNSTIEAFKSDHARVDSPKDNSVSSGRLEAGVDDSRNHLSGSVISESSMSMRNLIAAAQARRKQAHLQNNYDDMSRKSTSPSSAVQHSVPESSNVLQPEVLPSDNPPAGEEIEETRVSSGHHHSEGLLSGGTEAAVARDAFEGMIETLSRTRESIGRATRLAIDCAKHGIANEVVELLIAKLESERDDHRKVDLFFLVDSITQCSHSHKGVAGSSYIPTVQAALPRLLGAVAPRGAAAHENLRQYLKVLRLWLERKIFPESFLRRYIDSMGVSSNDAPTGLSRHPSRAERAVDDPLREIEGMLVDEYGSNATFQLPGLLSAHVFEDDEDDEPGPSYAEPETGSPVEELQVTPSETYAATPSDKRHCILEDVDGELEMEDVSGHPKEERLICENGSIESFPNHQHSDENMVEDSEDVSPLRGSPPLPHNSPPPTPPLPASPPPPPSPSSPPPPPPSFSSQPQAFAGLPPSLPPPMISQQFHLPPSSVPNLSPNLAYQPPPTLENSSTPSGNHFAQMAPNNTFRDHADASVRGVMNPHQSLPFKPTGINDSREASGFSSSRRLDYVHHDVHINSQPNKHFQARNPSFPQRPHPVPPPLSQPSHYGYQTNSPATQLSQHPYPRPYSLPNRPDGPRHYGGEWRRPTNEFEIENSRGKWMSGGGNLSSSSRSGGPYAREGYFSPPFERRNRNNIGFQPATPNPGNVVSPPMPSRPDMPGIDRWRPS